LYFLARKYSYAFLKIENQGEAMLHEFYFDSSVCTVSSLALMFLHYDSTLLKAPYTSCYTVIALLSAARELIQVSSVSEAMLHFVMHWLKISHAPHSYSATTSYCYPQTLLLTSLSVSYCVTELDFYIYLVVMPPKS
jgi:hypothetical protein